MGVESSPADLIATWLCNECFFKTRQHRSCKHNRSTKLAAARAIIFPAQIGPVHIVCLENAGMSVLPIDLHVHFRQQIDEIVYIEDVGYVANCNFLIGEKHGT